MRWLNRKLQLACGVILVSAMATAHGQESADSNELEALRVELQQLRTQLDARVSELERDVDGVAEVVGRGGLAREAALAERRRATRSELLLHAVRSIRVRDWAALLSCLTDAAQEQLAFELVATFAMREAINRELDEQPWTPEQGEAFRERLEKNVVSFCSRWIPEARIEAGESFGIRPEEQPLHSATRLDTVSRQLELLKDGLDPALPEDERRGARAEFARAFPDRAQLIGTMAELLVFESPEHGFPLPVSAGLRSIQEQGDRVEGSFAGRRGSQYGSIVLEKTGRRWQISRLSVGDPMPLYNEIARAIEVAAASEPADR